MAGGGPSFQPALQPTPAPPPPARTDAMVQRTATEQRAKYQGAQGGRTKTYLTSGTGGDATTSNTVRLLGNVGR